MNTMKSTILGAAAAVATLGAAPVWAQTDVTLMYTATAPFVTAFVAKDQGYFDDHGVNVELQLANNGSVIISGVVSGSAQVGLPTPTVAFQAIENGLELKTFASTNIFPDTTASGVVVGVDTGIETAADLVGKKVGVPGIGGLLDVTMREWIMSNGVDLADVNIVEVPLPQTADAIKGKQVDAVASVDPFATRAVETGVANLIGDYLSVVPADTAAGIYVTSAEWAAANPEAIEGMQMALDEAVEYIKSNPDGTRESIARYTSLPPQVVAGMAIPNVYTHLDTEKSFRFWVDLALAQNLITEEIDLDSFVIKYPGD
ncbi:MAG: ABC transporter substrate-binding protein [Pseudomonadota bacterium]|nr:ABC transporter substrate-binding protein [Pseudomonadota bacterium]